MQVHAGSIPVLRSVRKFLNKEAQMSKDGRHRRNLKQKQKLEHYNHQRQHFAARAQARLGISYVESLELHERMMHHVRIGKYQMVGEDRYVTLIEPWGNLYFGIGLHGCIITVFRREE
jgi:hypothetical protein